jgi:hypothetical protein
LIDRRRFPVDFDQTREMLRLAVMNADHPETQRARRALSEALERYGTPSDVPAPAPKTKLVVDLPHERSCLATFAVLFGEHGIDPVTAAAHVRGEGGRS